MLLDSYMLCHLLLHSVQPMFAVQGNSYMQAGSTAVITGRVVLVSSGVLQDCPQSASRSYRTMCGCVHLWFETRHSARSQLATCLSLSATSRPLPDENLKCLGRQTDGKASTNPSPNLSYDRLYDGQTAIWKISFAKQAVSRPLQPLLMATSMIVLAMLEKQDT